ncbi:uncharacterized protein LOC111597582 [Drosophila hydei]|uniref:Uncharacterized protein LOC111597582 n=1 Tax=Drosophila hydei TaxID=7224 RepID=A0A6J1LLA4_DROHY|nr:uncharacterized protein LOC111597582 [Drosophila hydei]
MENSYEDALELQLETPKMQIQLSNNSLADFRILGRFTENTLIVVYIQTYPLDALVADFLPRLLWLLHELHIVFITKEDPRIWQNDLYSYCFQNGFINVLLIQQLHQELALHSYNPYPTIRALRLPLLEDYLNRWRQLQNLQQYPIRTILFTVEPRIFQYVNRKGKLVYGGYMYNALKEFTHRHNLTIEIVTKVTNEILYITATTLLANHSVDIICYVKDPQLNQTATAPVHLNPFYIAVPYAQPIARYLYFARPFTWSLWIGVIVTIVYGMLMLYASNGNRGSEIGKHFLSSWCNLLFIAQPMISFANWQQVVIHFILLLSGFILTNFYLALLSSMLTSGLFEPQYNTLQDLARSPYPMLLDKYYADYIKLSIFLPEIVRRRIIVVEPQILESTRISLNTSYMYTGYSDRLDGILFQQHLLKVPLFKMTSQSLMDGFMSFPVVDGLPYLNMLNAYLRRIFEYGILTKMRIDAWLELLEGGITKFIASDRIEQKPYDLEFYYNAFALWSAGLVLATLCFLLEFVRSRMTNQFQL